jgi:hypothetical protein
MNTFKQINCVVCNQIISTGGAAFTSHLRAHVRKGEAMEFKNGNHLTFLSSKDHPKFIEEHPFAFLGKDPLPGQPKGIWEIHHLATELSAVNPAAYFITSGEATKKAERLVKDAYSLAVKARAFLGKLKKARGQREYLEVTHENGRLLVKSKDRRSKTMEAEKDEITRDVRAS